MPFWVGVGGTWRQATSGGQRIGVGGTWRKIENMWVGVGGTWRPFFSSVQLPPTILINHEVVSPHDPTAAIQFLGSDSPSSFWGRYGSANTSGIPFGPFVYAGNWVSDGTDMSPYQIRATVVSGSPVSGSSATGTWLDFSTSRIWGVQRTINVPGTTRLVLTIEIRRASDGVVLTSSTVTLDATVAE